MDNVFLLLATVSLFCIPIFLTMGLISVIRRRSFKKRFKLAGISALALVVSFVGFGLTSDQNASPKGDRPSPVSAEAPSSSYALAENASVEPSPAPVADLSPSPTPIPTPVPTEAPTPIPTALPQQTEPSGNSSSTMVWIDDTAKRYHKKNGCGMDNAYQVTLEEAIAKGKTPCGNCYR